MYQAQRKTVYRSNKSRALVRMRNGWRQSASCLLSSIASLVCSRFYKRLWAEANTVSTKFTFMSSQPKKSSKITEFFSPKANSDKMEGLYAVICAFENLRLSLCRALLERVYGIPLFLLKYSPILFSIVVTKDSCSVQIATPQASQYFYAKVFHKITILRP